MCYAKHDQVQDIFRIERDGEKDRFTKSPYAKSTERPPTPLARLSLHELWRNTVSRPTDRTSGGSVSGYMFGKGVYLADISSKSANYCVPSMSGDVGLLLYVRLNSVSRCWSWTATPMPGGGQSQRMYSNVGPRYHCT
jgi:poly [ADP-ribose] polymerase